MYQYKCFYKLVKAVHLCHLSFLAWRVALLLGLSNNYKLFKMNSLTVILDKVNFDSWLNLFRV